MSTWRVASVPLQQSQCDTSASRMPSPRGVEARSDAVSARRIRAAALSSGGAPLGVFLVTAADDQLVSDLSSRHDRGAYEMA